MSARQAIENRFAIGLLNPSSRIAIRWPTPIPVPTAVLTWKGTTTITANAAGFLFCAGDFSGRRGPSLTGGVPAIYNANDVTLGPLSDVSAVTPVTVVIAPYAAGDFRQFRLVSAELQIYDTNSVNSRSGSFIVASCPAIQMFSAGASSDTLKDAYYSFQTGTARADGARAVALPMSGAASGFASFFTGAATDFSPPSQWSLPMFALTNGIANGTYTIAWIANYEVIPAANKMDLFPVRPGPLGTPDEAVVRLGGMVPNANAYNAAMIAPAPIFALPVGGAQGDAEVEVPLLEQQHPINRRQGPRNIMNDTFLTDHEDRARGRRDDALDASFRTAHTEGEYVEAWRDVLGRDDRND